MDGEKCFCPLGREGVEAWSKRLGRLDHLSYGLTGLFGRDIGVGRCSEKCFRLLS